MHPTTSTHPTPSTPTTTPTHTPLPPLNPTAQPHTFTPPPPHTTPTPTTSTTMQRQPVARDRRVTSFRSTSQIPNFRFQISDFRSQILNLRSRPTTPGGPIRPRPTGPRTQDLLFRSNKISTGPPTRLVSTPI